MHDVFAETRSGQLVLECRSCQTSHKIPLEATEWAERLNDFMQQHRPLRTP